MNSYFKPVMLLSIILLSVSCVSKKKYLESENHIKRLQTDSINCRHEVRKISAEKLGIESEKAVTEQSLTQQLIIKQEELNAKANQLYERERKLRELDKVINKQNESINNLRNSIANALVNFKPEELSVEIRESKLYVSMQEQLLFKTASARVDPKGKEALGKLAEVLNNNKDIDIVIEGHTDSIPISKKFDDNWDLSVNRAISIARILQKDYHIDPKRLIASGRGEFFPVETNSTPQGRQRNRRTEIILFPKLDDLYELIDNRSNPVKK